MDAQYHLGFYVKHLQFGLYIYCFYFVAYTCLFLF